MLFLHEVHRVIGAKADEFEEGFRKGLMPALAKADDARLLWYSNHAMGSGVSYNVVTITALKDGAAWERLALSFQKGALQGWVRDVDTLRHDAIGKLLLPLHWSPIQQIDFRSIPIDGREHALSLYMEDTMWPYREQYLRYIDTSGAVYSKSLEVADPFIKIEAGFQPAFSSHVRREVMLMQKILKIDQLRHLLTNEIPIEQRRPGGWMHEALVLRDQWESKLLRTSSWSPLF
jgi:hypothetical protein